MNVRTFTADVPESVIHYNPEDQSREGEPIPVEFEWTAGTEPSGMMGPPEDYDPGSGDEFYIVSHDFEERTNERVIDWLNDNWERPDCAAEEADYRYQQWRDEQMERRR